MVIFNKKKDAMALFEVMVRDPKPVYGAAQRGAASDYAAESATAATAPVAVQPPLGPQPGESSPRDLSGVPGGQTSCEPVFVSDGERIRVSMTPVGWMILAVSFMLVVLGAFFLGQMSKNRPLATAPPQDLPIIHSSQPLMTTPPAGASAVVRPATTVERYYVVVQNMLDDSPATRLEKARKIVAFLHERSVPAFIYRTGRDEYKVVSEKPFDQDNSPAIEAHGNGILAFGKEYMRIGGYDFRHGPSGLHTLRLPWPLPEDIKVR